MSALFTVVAAFVTRSDEIQVDLHETYEDTANFYLVMEYCTGGELMARIEKMTQFSEKVVNRVCVSGMLNGATYIATL